MSDQTPALEYGVFLHQEERVPELPDIEILTKWIEQVLQQESTTLQSVYFVFVDDDAILDINREHLQHDTYTDIITFPYKRNPLEAEIYISSERVRANALTYGVSVKEELLRVMAHGLLHVCGWDDHSQKDANLMRRRENACLVLMDLLPKGYAFSPIK